jgi:formylmethanofuran dehydrogenase subunit E
MKYEDLQQKYPIFLGNYFYFECDIGWFKLLDETCSKIEEINRAFENPKYKITAFQIKQKFGTLRVYVDYSDELIEDSEIYSEVFKTINDLTWEVESKSYKICERCGEPAEQRTFGNRYIETLCEKCYSK